MFGRKSRKEKMEMGVVVKTPYSVARFLSAPVIGERCRIMDTDGDVWMTSPVTKCAINQDGSGYIETQNSVYTCATVASKPAKKTVDASQFISKPCIGERCRILLMDGRTALTSTVVSVCLQDDGSGYIETRNSKYVVASTGTVFAGC